METSDFPRLQALTFETAGEHFLTDVPIAHPGQSAAQVRALLVGRRFETVAAVPVCDNGRLVGMLRTEDVLAAPEDSIAEVLMDREPPVVAPGIDQEVAAWRAVQHGESALAVVDEAGRLLGLIPPQRLLAVLLWEHEEDISRLAGVMRGTAAARLASEEPVWRRFWHRVPWLLIGLAGAVLATDLVGIFEHQLEDHLVLAFFIPGIVYLADAVGTQTEALAIRGLSVGVGIARVLVRELLTGLFVGLTLAAIFFPIALVRWGELDVALAVSLALLCASATATVVALALPWLFHRLGQDPAFGSGPIATVIQDLLSILVYFLIATAIVA